jgi:hypothetical protein
MARFKSLKEQDAEYTPTPLQRTRTIPSTPPKTRFKRRVPQPTATPSPGRRARKRLRHTSSSPRSPGVHSDASLPDIPPSPTPVTFALPLFDPLDDDSIHHAHSTPLLIVPPPSPPPVIPAAPSSPLSQLEDTPALKLGRPRVKKSQKMPGPRTPFTSITPDSNVSADILAALFQPPKLAPPYSRRNHTVERTQWAKKEMEQKVAERKREKEARKAAEERLKLEEAQRVSDAKHPRACSSPEGHSSQSLLENHVGQRPQRHYTSSRRSSEAAPRPRTRVGCR